MFARKRKPRDEEPLVPHGMIWQATEESMPPGNAEKPASQGEPSSAKPIEMPKFWRNPVLEPDPSVRRAPASVRNNEELPAELPKGIPKKIEAKAEPLRWPLAPVKELTKRRMVIQEERAQDKQTAKPAPSNGMSVARVPSPVAWPDQAANSNAPVPAKPILVPPPPRSEPTVSAQVQPTATAQLSETQPQPNETQPRPSATQAKVSMLREDASKILAWLGRIERERVTAIVDLARDCRSATVRGLSELDRRIKSIYNARTLAHKMRLAAQVTGKGDASPVQHANADLQAQVPAANTASPPGKSTVPLFLFETRRRVAAFNSFVVNLPRRRVRIRLVAGASPLRISRTLSRTRVLAADTLRKNNRLLTALAMAGVSAVLALGLIAAMRRYEPTNRANISKQTRVSAEALAPTALATHQSPLKAASAVVATPTSVQTASNIPTGETSGKGALAIRTAASQKQIRRRTHHNQDEGYVAKDTYVYYGNR